MLNVLDTAFGSAYKPVPAPAPGGGERFWSAELRDVRVAVDSDTPSRNTAFVSSGHFRAVLGGNSVRMESKNVMAKKEPCASGFIFCSNYEPQISDLKADRRRLIYTYITPPSEAQLAATKGHEQDYQNALLHEAPWVLAAAAAMYERLCPKKGLIPASSDDEVEIVSTEDDECSRLYDNLFEPSTGENKIEDKDLLNKEFMKQAGDDNRPARSLWRIPYVPWDDVSFVLRYLAPSQDIEMRKFKRYCQAHRGVVISRNKNSNESRTRWIGLIAKPSFKSILRYRE